MLHAIYFLGNCRIEFFIFLLLFNFFPRRLEEYVQQSKSIFSCINQVKDIAIRLPTVNLSVEFIYVSERKTFVFVND